jgi:hypothetical protein
VYLLKVLNDANEWKTVTQLFDSKEAAVNWFRAAQQGTNPWMDYQIEPVERSQ